MNGFKDDTLNIGQVARKLHVETSTLRYWEKEFPEFLCPRRSPGGQREYTARDVRGIREIYRLVHVELFTIEGARRQLKKRFGESGRQQEKIVQLESKVESLACTIEQLISEIRDLKKAG